MVRYTSFFKTFRIAGAALVLAGCGGGGAAPVIDRFSPAQIDTSDRVQPWAQSSAPQIFAFPVVVAASAAGAMDTSCPMVTRSGDTTTYRGGCTDRNGRTWYGTLTTVGVEISSMALAPRPARSGSMNFEDFGFSGMETCNGMQVSTQTKFRGIWTVTDAGNNRGNFRVDLIATGTAVNAETGCMPQNREIAVEYSGSYALSGEDRNGDGSPDVQTWNGSGRIGDSGRGRVQAQTTDEVLDPMRCNSEALSGTTTLQSGSSTVVITYDGATDCSMQSTVRWSHNGMDMGELSGVRCAVGATPGRGRGALALLGCVAGLALVRRRRERR